jgi:hypothetical protein
MSNPTNVLALHPGPWSAKDDGHFSMATPLTILDAEGVPVCAVVTFAEMDEPTDPRDHIVAHAITHLPTVIASLRMIAAYDDALNGTAPGYHDAKAPEGADYNKVVTIAATLLRLLEGEA